MTLVLCYSKLENGQRWIAHLHSVDATVGQPYRADDECDCGGK